MNKLKINYYLNKSDLDNCHNFNYQYEQEHDYESAYFCETYSYHYFDGITNLEQITSSLSLSFSAINVDFENDNQPVLPNFDNLNSISFISSFLHNLLTRQYRIFSLSSNP